MKLWKGRLLQSQLSLTLREGQRFHFFRSMELLRQITQLASCYIIHVQLVAILLYSCVGIVPISVTVPPTGITFNVTATEDDIALESNSAILRFESDFGPSFIERVEAAGEHLRDTTTIRIIDNDGE